MLNRVQSGFSGNSAGLDQEKKVSLDHTSMNFKMKVSGHSMSSPKLQVSESITVDDIAVLLVYKPGLHGTFKESSDTGWWLRLVVCDWQSGYCLLLPCRTVSTRT